MKRVKIFIASAAFVLAIGGVLATKANRLADTFYYVSGSDCVTYGTSSPCTAGTVHDCTYLGGTVYKNDATCSITADIVKKP